MASVQSFSQNIILPDISLCEIDEELAPEQFDSLFQRFEKVTLEYPLDTIKNWNKERQVDHFKYLFTQRGNITENFQHADGSIHFFPEQPVCHLWYRYVIFNSRGNLWKPFLKNTEKRLGIRPFSDISEDIVYIRIWQIPAMLASHLKIIDIEFPANGSIKSIYRETNDEMFKKDSFPEGKTKQTFNLYSNKTYRLMTQNEIWNFPSESEIPSYLYMCPDGYSLTFEIMHKGEYAFFTYSNMMYKNCSVANKETKVLRRLIHTINEEFETDFMEMEE